MYVPPSLQEEADLRSHYLRQQAQQQDEIRARRDKEVAKQQMYQQQQYNSEQQYNAEQQGGPPEEAPGAFTLQQQRRGTRDVSPPAMRLIREASSSAVAAVVDVRQEQPAALGGRPRQRSKNIVDADWLDKLLPAAAVAVAEPQGGPEPLTKGA